MNILSFYLMSIIYTTHNGILYSVMANFECEQQLTPLNCTMLLQFIPVAADVSVSACIVDRLLNKVQEKDHMKMIHMYVSQ